jgi:hypothetical protein
MKRYSLLLMLLGLLGAFFVSQVATSAASPARPTSTFAHPTLRDNAEPEEEFEAEEAEFEFEECEAGAEFEFEECEAGAEFEFEEEGEEEEFEAEEEGEEECGNGAAAKASKKGIPFVTAPTACQVRQAESTITALPGSDQIRLDVRYQTYSPTSVTIGLKLKDHKGSVAIEHATKHLGGKGVLHLTTELGSAVMERALAASEFDVALRAPETPGFCADALEQRLLSVKHTSARAPRVYAN